MVKMRLLAAKIIEMAQITRKQEFTSSKDITAQTEESFPIRHTSFKKGRFHLGGKYNGQL